MGRHTTLVGRVLAAVALFTLLTGAAEERGGVIIHVELVRAEHPPPEGHDSWEGVTPGGAAGDHYYWRPGGSVVVQRTDGTVVRARNDFATAGLNDRVSILESRSGDWFITAVERQDEGDIYAPSDPGPMVPGAQVTEADTLEQDGGWTFARDES